MNHDFFFYFCVPCVQSACLYLRNNFNISVFWIAPILTSVATVLYFDISIEEPEGCKPSIRK